MDDFLDWRVPTEPNVALADVQYAHAARWYHSYNKVAVVYGYELHAFLLSASQDGVFDRPRSLGLEFLLTD